MINRNEEILQAMLGILYRNFKNNLDSVKQNFYFETEERQYKRAIDMTLVQFTNGIEVEQKEYRDLLLRAIDNY